MEESPQEVAVSKVGPYRVLDEIGKGGMGVVYRAAHESSDELVALKVVRLPVTSMLASIRREVYALQRLRHPGVVRIVDQGVDPALGPWYAMELLSGASMRQRLSEWFPGELDDCPPPRRTVSPERLTEVLTLFRRVCGALAYVHANGIVHRDLKPENVHLASELRTALVDFGLASQFGSKEVAMQVQNRGSLPYMAPEQISQGNVDARADLYALGCMLHECLAGFPPFRGPTRNSLIAQQLHVVPPPVSEYVGGIPPALDQLVARLLQKRPSDRLGYAADVARVLASLGALGDDEPSGAAVTAYLYRASFVGRERPFAQIEEVVQSRAPHATTVFVVGESGVGKTRLLLEAAAHVRNLRWQVIEGRCEPSAAGKVTASALQLFQPFLQWVADRCREEPARFETSLVEPFGAVLALYEPSFEALVAALPEAARARAVAPPQLTQAKVLECLHKTLRLAVAGGKLLLTLDDVQWADELSLAFLRAVVEDPTPTAGLVVMVACRAEEMTAEIRKLAVAPRALQIDLGRLGVEQVASVVGAMLAMDDVPRELAQFVHGRSDGNPFFVAEYLRAAIEEGLLQRDVAGRWSLTERGHDEEAYQHFAAPRSINEVVQRRLTDLSDNARAALEAAAVLGREFDSELFAAVLGAPETSLLEAVEELRRRQVVEEGSLGRLRFVHDRLREVALEPIDASRRDYLHRRAAEAMELREDIRDDVAALGHHWSCAGVDDKAARYLTLAGDRASRAFANQDALKLYERASEHARALTDRGAQWRDALNQIDERRGDVLERTGAHASARVAYESALKRVDAGDRVWRARLHRLSAKTRETAHGHTEAQRAYDAAMTALGEAPPETWRVHETWGEGIAAPDESPDAWWREWVQVQVERVLMYYWDADVVAMTALVDRVRDAVDQRGTPTQRARFHIAIVQNDLRRSRYRIATETVRHARAAVEATEEARDSEQNGYARFAYAFTLIFSGNWDDGEREIRAALAQSLKVGDAVTQQRCRSYLTTVLRFCGKTDEVRRENESFLKISKASQMRDYEGVAHAQSCVARLEGGRR